jgi:hypothetical protein
MQLLCNRAKTRTRSFEATGFGICEEEEEEEEEATDGIFPLHLLLFGRPLYAMHDIPFYRCILFSC